MKTIDMEHWDRKEHFAYFCGIDYPQFNICANIDITGFLNYAKSNGLPFYYAMIYAATAAADSVVNFRYRIRNGAVVLLDRLHPSFTAMNNDSNLFKYVTVDMCDNMRAFAETAQEAAQRQKGLFGDGEERDDLVYLSCVPWISFTHISHTISLNKNDSIPRISWGRYFAEGDKTLLPLSVQVNHALADGFHIGQYFTALSAFMENL